MGIVVYSLLWVMQDGCVSSTVVRKGTGFGFLAVSVCLFGIGSDAIRL